MVTARVPRLFPIHARSFCGTLRESRAGVSYGKILIADDNLQITNILVEYAKREGHSCCVARDGEEALALFRRQERDIDMVLLDIMMPKLDGLEVCRAIRRRSLVPIILITARGEDSDKILGLDTGADDYLVKPFSPAEVMARIRAILRRVPGDGGQARTIRTANLFIDIDNYLVRIDGQEVRLTKREKELLWLLASKPMKVFPGTTCWTASGAATTTATAAPSIPTSSGSGPNWKTIRIRSGASRPSGGWDTVSNRNRRPARFLRKPDPKAAQRPSPRADGLPNADRPTGRRPFCDAWIAAPRRSVRRRSGCRRRGHASPIPSPSRSRC